MMTDKNGHSLPPYISDETGKIFVGGLSWSTTQESLLDYFGKYGEVIDCVVMNNSTTGKSRGFGFVKYRDPNCVNEVLSCTHHTLDGRMIDPKACNPRSQNKAKLGEKKQKIFIGGLAPAMNEELLKNFFEENFGKVSEVTIMCDQQKDGSRGNSRGFGFVSFEDREVLEEICHQHYITIDGKQVECKPAEPRDTTTYRSSTRQVWKMLPPGAVYMTPQAPTPPGTMYMNQGSLPPSPGTPGGPMFQPAPMPSPIAQQQVTYPQPVYYTTNWVPVSDQYMPSSPTSSGTPNFSAPPSPGQYQSVPFMSEQYVPSSPMTAGMPNFSAPPSPGQYSPMAFACCTCDTPRMPSSPYLSPPSTPQAVQCLKTTAV